MDTNPADTLKTILGGADSLKTTGLDLVSGTITTVSGWDSFKKVFQWKFDTKKRKAVDELVDYCNYIFLIKFKQIGGGYYPIVYFVPYSCIYTQGIRFIMDAVEAVFPKALYLNNRGEFIDRNGNIRSLFGANWQPLACKTDFQRLGRHELLYRGILRTNIVSMMNNIKLGTHRYRLSSELFALTADVYVLLGMIKLEDYTCETADGKGKSMADAARRLARVVCADTVELEFDEILNIARQVYEYQKHELAEAMGILSFKYGIDNIVGAGLGEFLIKDTAFDAGLI